MLDLCIIRHTYTGRTEDGEPLDSDTGFELVENLELHEAIELCRREGVRFDAVGNGLWAALPDGSHVLDYATGREEEVSIHPQGSWWPWEYEAFTAGVDGDASEALSWGYLISPKDHPDHV